MNTKTIYLAIILAIGTFSASAQYVTIPDANFRNALKLLIPSAFNNAEEMDITNVSVTGLKSLNLSSNFISNLDGIQYFSGLTYLNCSFNFLTNISLLPDSLSYLNCTYNNLTNISSLPSGLNTLVCYNNQLTSLPTLPSSLTFLSCFSNKLTSLPALPSGMTTLSCYSNKLTSLPELPTGLTGTFYCMNNQLTSLPALPTGLGNLYCYGNQLTSLPDLPNDLFSLVCYNNNLKCLPTLPNTLLSLTLDTYKVTCIPNKPNSLAIWDINNNRIDKPICSYINNPNDCAYFPIISGKVFEDINKNGVQDLGENPRSFQKINLSNGAYTFSNDEGLYQISVETLGNVLLSVAAPNYYMALPSTANFTFANYSDYETQNIALQPTQTIDELKIEITPERRARPGFPFSYKLEYENTGTTDLSNSNISLDYDDSRLTFTSTSIAAINTGSAVSFNLSPLLRPGEKGEITLNFVVKTTVLLGDYLCAMTSGTVAGKSITKDTTCTIISGSVDPNDKQASATISPNQISSGGFIDYNIRFQNTGTDTAFTVLIADTLSPKLLFNTLELVSTSHNCKVETNVAGKVVYFKFRNILLPDSNVNKRGSQGYVRFKVRPISTLILDDIVNNKANIYFDFNTPIITNTATTTVAFPNRIVLSTDNSFANSSFMVWPNPAHRSITVSESGILSIRSLLGIEINAYVVEPYKELDISQIATGTYIYVLNGKRGKLVVK
ncbi:MAG: hypothetical protein K2Q22_00470 [Cytophagales bacterium]|nr:hypothetical protein [Cytophagales bacterium]